LAIASLVLGIVWLGGIGAILAVIFGHTARRQIREAQGAQSGDGLAVAGLILGWIGIVSILLVVILVASLGFVANNVASSNRSNQFAQSNLTNALTEGKALYEVNDSYAYSQGGAYNVGPFTSQAPEFSWEVGSACPTTLTNCISAQVFGVAAAGDSQGLALAVDSPQANTCWYAFDVESTPGTPLIATFPTSGIWLGKQTPIPAGGCVALNPDSDPGIVFSTPMGLNFAKAATVS
jgi:hypothetical protein